MDRKFSVAPMMDWTDRHCRYFMRLISKNALLYTEMVVDQAILRGDVERLLQFDAKEHPLALQLGGSDPSELARAAAIGAEFGYDEINLNVGCPSDRVQSGEFGACLMTKPEHVGECFAAIAGSVDIPVSIKCRTGVDDMDDEGFFHNFIDIVSDAGCRIFIVHARKAWLSGLSPKQNRDIPPIDYDRVHRLKRKRPELQIVVNGGIQDLDEADTHLQHTNGVMLGRAAYHNPWLLSDVDRRYYGAGNSLTRADIATSLLGYVEAQLSQGVRLHQITRHILGLYHGVPGAKVWRQRLSEEAVKDGAGTEVIVEAMAQAEQQYDDHLSA
jgi:tRNA-dihydrouridine synthase A